jgi:hypothetical protein
MLWCFYIVSDDALFEKYTGPLAECLADFGMSIQAEISGDADNSAPLVASEAHANVQALIEELEEDCRNLPLFRVRFQSVLSCLLVNP